MGILAARAVEQAIHRAVEQAESLHGVGGADRSGDAVLGHRRQLIGLGLIQSGVGEDAADHRVLSHGFPAENVPLL